MRNIVSKSKMLQLVVQVDTVTKPPWLLSVSMQFQGPILQKTQTQTHMSKLFDSVRSLSVHHLFSSLAIEDLDLVVSVSLRLCHIHRKLTPRHGTPERRSGS